MPSSSQGSSGTSWNTTVAGMSPRLTGKSGGENDLAMRSCSECTGEGGPQMWTSRLGPPQWREEAEPLQVVEV